MRSFAGTPEEVGETGEMCEGVAAGDGTTTAVAGAAEGRRR